MNWIDIVSIVFVCVTMNHLGLMGKIEDVMGKHIPVLNCPKCASFWFTFAYFMGKMGFLVIPKIPLVLAISFISAYAAIWLELLEGYIDTLYLKLYGKIYETTDDTPASDPDGGHSAGSVSEL